jgi:hypothetical protein
MYVSVLTFGKQYQSAGLASMTWRLTLEPAHPDFSRSNPQALALSALPDADFQPPAQLASLDHNIGFQDDIHFHPGLPSLLGLELDLIEFRQFLFNWEFTLRQQLALLQLLTT